MTSWKRLVSAEIPFCFIEESLLVAFEATRAIEPALHASFDAFFDTFVVVVVERVSLTA